MKRPTVTTKCIAGAYAGPQERIVEFSFPGGEGGLISLRYASGKARVEVYRTDGKIEVVAPLAQP